MLRRHFITGEEIPDFIITYYAPEHIPFCNGYKDEIDSIGLNDNSEVETKFQFKCILDIFNDGVGQYGIKLLSDNNGLWCSNWSTKFNPLNDLSSLGFYHEFNSGITYDNTNDITCIILPKEIKHLNGTLMQNPNPYNYSVEIIILPEYLETFNNKVLYSLQAIKNIVIPDTVTFMSDRTLQIDCNNDIVGTSKSGNMSLEEIILKPFNPPDSDTNNPIGVYDTSRYINPNLKIRVYADCIDKYKNDSVWGQYFDLYDTINNAVVCYTDKGERKIYERDNDIYEIKEYDVPNFYSRIYLPNTTYFIRKNAFRYFDLTDINMPSVTVIEEYAFSYSKLRTINISSVNEIGDYAFAYCNSLKFITIPENLSIIGKNAFNYCYFAKNNIIGDYDKIKVAGAYIYDVETEDGYLITKYSEGDILEQIRPNIKNIIISDDIKYIGNDNHISFYSNDIIESIYIGKNVKGNYKPNVGFDDYRLKISLGYSDNIKSLKVDPLNPYYDSRNDCNAIIETATNTLLLGCPTTTIPNTVEIIEYNRAFERIDIETLNIPLSVKKIIDIYRPDTDNYTKINTIIYEGTIEQWNAIEKIGDVYEKAAIIIKCSDGEIKYFTTT